MLVNDRHMIIHGMSITRLSLVLLRIPVFLYLFSSLVVLLTGCASSSNGNPTLELWDCVRALHQVPWDEQAIDNLRRFAQAGGMVALGTDYAGYRCDFDLGMPMTEIELMLQAGMTICK